MYMLGYIAWNPRSRISWSLSEYSADLYTSVSNTVCRLHHCEIWCRRYTVYCLHQISVGHQCAPPSCRCVAHLVSDMEALMCRLLQCITVGPQFKKLRLHPSRICMNVLMRTNKQGKVPQGEIRNSSSCMGLTFARAFCTSYNGSHSKTGHGMFGWVLKFNRRWALR